MAKSDKIEIPREEYERLRAAHERMHTKSGRMSLRLPPDTWKQLIAESDRTGKGKTKIVLDALARYFGAGKAKSGLFD